MGEGWREMEASLQREHGGARKVTVSNRVRCPLLPERGAHEPIVAVVFRGRELQHGAHEVVKVDVFQRFDFDATTKRRPVRDQDAVHVG